MWCNVVKGVFPKKLDVLLFWLGFNEPKLNFTTLPYLPLPNLPYPTLPYLKIKTTTLPNLRGYILKVIFDKRCFYFFVVQPRLISKGVCRFTL